METICVNDIRSVFLLTGLARTSSANLLDGGRCWGCDVERTGRARSDARAVRGARTTNQADMQQNH